MTTTDRQSPARTKTPGRFSTGSSEPARESDPVRVKAVDVVHVGSESLASTKRDGLTITVYNRESLPVNLERFRRFAFANQPYSLGIDPTWLMVFEKTLGHDPYVIEAVKQGQLVGILPLAEVSSFLFGKYLVSLPYLNSNGPITTSPCVRDALISRAADLAEELSVKHLELRMEAATEHPRLNVKNESKVHMRMAMPVTAELLWKSFDPKVRNQIRKAEKSNFTLSWGGLDHLDPFMDVISHNMRDLGTPFYGRDFFAMILSTFPGDAEIAVLRTPEGQAVAAGFLLHGQGITEVPSASSLREFNSSCANMLLYRHLLERAIERKQTTFDFGRSTIDGPTFKFKKQWGAVPQPACWQYASKSGSVGDARPDNPKYRLAIKLWQKLPVKVTRKIGPMIVRGIP